MRGVAQRRGQDHRGAHARGPHGADPPGGGSGRPHLAAPVDTASRAHILRNLEKNLGGGLVEDLEFRVVPRRREPQRATAALPGPAPAADEADGIADPVLRAIYRASRKKAQA